jgi:glycosyltransferase involved in cell wall biosynthesis
MTISVVIPTYNYGRFIQEAIDSVLVQTFDDLEIVVVDDGSTDNTLEIVAAIQDPRIRVVRTPHLGISAARNEGLAQIQGEFIAFLDADDRWRPDKLERQIRIMDAEPDLGAVFTNFVRFDEHGVYPQDQFTFFPELNTTPTTVTRDGAGRRIVGDAFCTLVAFGEIPAWLQTILFRSAVVKDIRFATSGLYKGICGDWNFCLRVYRRGQVGFIETPLVEVRRHGSNTTSRLSDAPYAHLAALRLLEGEPLSATQRKALHRRLGRALIGVGLQNVADGRFRGAILSFMHALAFAGARLSALKNLALFIIPRRNIAIYSEGSKDVRAAPRE